jgi:hypothetical protein
VTSSTPAPRSRDLAQQLDDLAAARAVEVAGRLVGEDQPRFAHESARDRDALQLAAGKRLRCLLGLCGDPDALEPRPRLGARLARWCAGEHELQGDVLERRDASHQLGTLVDEAYVALQVVAGLTLGQRGDRAPVEADLALVGVEQGGDEQQHCRLARAAGPVQSQHLAGMEREGCAVDGADLLAAATVALDYALQLEQSHCG